MTTIGSDPSKFEIGVIVCIALLFGFMLWTVGNYQFFENPKQYHEAPCSSFKSLPINQLPARCVTPEGGFKP